MLNTVPGVSNTAMACIAAPAGNAPTGSAEGRPFSLALDQAEARQRAASHGEEGDAAADAASDAAAEPAPAAPVAANPQPVRGDRRETVRRASWTDALADARLPAAEAAQLDTAPTQAPQVEDSDEDTRDRAGQALIDLAALMSGLPLQHLAAAATAAAAPQPVDRTLQPEQALAPGSARKSAGTSRAVGSMPEADSGKESPTHVAQAAGTVALTAPAPAGAPAAKDLGARVAPAALATAAVAGSTKDMAEATLQVDVPARQAARQETSLDPNAASTPLATAWTAAAPRSHDTNLPFQAELQAAVGSNQFAPALGAQLSVLVRDGIEHAQLKLNPADMGPIEVRISLDGSQAQVDFSAAQAGTRQALQDAVPALASALRESGLTLTGGGVFEQPRDQRGEARQDRARGSAPGGSTALDVLAPANSPQRMPRARGVVDLYA